jgi:hypothetical protein
MSLEWARARLLEHRQAMRRAAAARRDAAITTWGPVQPPAANDGAVTATVLRLVPPAGKKRA